MVYAPVGFAAILAVVCLFVAALLVTAKMVEAIDREQTPDLRASWAEVVPRWRGVLIFSVKFLVACGASLAATAFPAYLLLGAVRHREIATSAIFLNLGTLTIVCCLVLLLVPAAVRLLQVEQKSNMPVSLRGQAVVFAAVATEAGLLLGMFAQKLEAGIVLDHRWELTILSALNSIVANAPDVLFFIALALLALGTKENTAEQSDSSALPPDSLVE
jgi:hypothetical protein